MGCCYGPRVYIIGRRTGVPCRAVTVLRTAMAFARCQSGLARRMVSESPAGAAVSATAEQMTTERVAAAG